MRGVLRTNERCFELIADEMCKILLIFSNSQKNQVQYRIIHSLKTKLAKNSFKDKPALKLQL